MPNFYAFWDSLKLIGNRPGARQLSKPRLRAQAAFLHHQAHAPRRGLTPLPERRRAGSLPWGTPKPLPKIPGSDHSAFLGRKKHPQPSRVWPFLSQLRSSPGCFPLLVASPCYVFLLLDVFSPKIPPKRDYFPRFHTAGGALQLSWDFVPAGMLQAQAAAVPPAGLPPCPPGSCSAKK